MPTIVRPSEHIDWCENSPPAGAIISPSQAYRDAGWFKGQHPPYQVFNWFFNSVGNWLEYLEQQTDLADAFRAAFICGVGSKGGAVVTPGGTLTVTKVLHAGAILTIDSVAAAALGPASTTTLNLPLVADAVNMVVTFKDITGKASNANILVKAISGNLPIEGSSVASFALSADFGSWTFWCNGTSWYLI